MKYKKIIFIILLIFQEFFCEILLCDNERYSSYHNHINLPIAQWLGQVNEELLLFNQKLADIAWQLSVNPTDVAVNDGAQLGALRTEWRNTVCSEACRYVHHNLTVFEYRQIHLLCRGPKWTPREAGELSRILDDLQEIYTSTEVCIPENIQIENLYENTFFKKNGVLKKWDYYFDNLFNNLQFFQHPEETQQGYVKVLKGLLKNRLMTNNTSMRKTSYICFSGEPDLERLVAGNYPDIFKKLNLSVEQHEMLLRWAWEAWRSAVGPPIREVYPKLVQVQNIGAINNGYQDIGQVWREELEIKDLEKISLKLLEDIMPLYKLLHAVIRYALSKKYNIEIKGRIPAHLMGNMWSQNWESLHSILVDSPINLDERIRETKWTPVEMVKHAEDFYTSLGLSAMTEKFWNYSSFSKQNSTTKCHGTAANMFVNDDYRILLCADLTLEDFYIIHHELGHIEYYINYEKIPVLLRDGANSAFQESIGDAIMFGVMTPQHLNRLKLVNDSFLYQYFTPQTDVPVKLTKKRGINYTMVDKPENVHFDIVLLLRQILSKLPQIPFSYLVDKYRWNIFNGKIKEKDYNKYFWKLVQTYQGIDPPNVRSETYFDAGAKFHIPDNTPYIRYFLSSFLQVQIFRGMCTLSLYGKFDTGNKLPMMLHRCDIYGSKKAGMVLKLVLRLGASTHWSEDLKILTGSKEMSADPLLEYFEPISKWLKKIIIENDIPVGW